MLLVLGFSTIFLVISNNFNSLVMDSVTNYSKYYEKTVAHNIAVSASNLAATQVFFNNDWIDGFPETEYGGGIFSTTVNILDSTTKQILTISEFGEFVDTVIVTFQPSKFSKFAYFSEIEPSNIWWTTGDTVWGPMHVQGELSVKNRPVFWGKVTCQDGIHYDPNDGYWDYQENGGHYETRWVRKRIGRRWRYVEETYWVVDYDRVWVNTADPQFYGGFDSGVNKPLPDDGVSNLLSVAQSNGVVFQGQDTVYLTFDEDSIKYRFSKNDLDTSVLAASFSPNGTIFAEEAVLRLKGTVEGQFTVGVSASSSSNGKVFLDDDIVYKTDPRVTNSTDLLGIVAFNDVMITNNAPNSSDINIHASIYSENGGFGSEDYASRPAGGSINLLGGIQQYTRRAVGTFSGSTIVSGFSKKYRYDDRLMLTSPPSYPGTGAFEIVSWYE